MAFVRSLLGSLSLLFALTSQVAQVSAVPTDCITVWGANEFTVVNQVFLLCLWSLLVLFVVVLLFLRSAP